MPTTEALPLRSNPISDPIYNNGNESQTAIKQGETHPCQQASKSPAHINDIQQLIAQQAAICNALIYRLISDD